MKKEFSVDGIMIGRAAIGNPWIFREIRYYLAQGSYHTAPSLEEKVHICRQHLVESIKWKGERLALLEMRKHYRHYFHDIPNIKPLRLKMCETMSVDEIEDILGQIIHQERAL